MRWVFAGGVYACLYCLPRFLFWVLSFFTGLQECLFLGNLDAKRDWGHARDYVQAMWMMLQADTPDDYVVGTGVTQTVRLLVERAFYHVGKSVSWQGEGVNEVGIDETGVTVVRIDPAYFRPTEVELLLSDPSKIKRNLGWQTQITFDKLVQEMIQADLIEVSREA
jgi:GDPmannose 4,6-dehydratase